jgi:hypothetical protein
VNIDRHELIAVDKPLVDTAWSVLDAANDLRDTITVEACRRVIDATLRGAAPAQSDMNFVFDFFR